MEITFSEMVQQYINDGDNSAIPNPAHSGYLCKVDDFLSELLQFLSMMQVVKVGVGNEIAGIKKDIQKVNYSLKVIRSNNQLYKSMNQAINCLIDICNIEGEKAQKSGERMLSETYAWTIAGCCLFLKHVQLTKP